MTSSQILLVGGRAIGFLAFFGAGALALIYGLVVVVAALKERRRRAAMRETCTACHGTGKIAQHFAGEVTEMIPCPACFRADPEIKRALKRFAKDIAGTDRLESNPEGEA